MDDLRPPTKEDSCSVCHIKFTLGKQKIVIVEEVETGKISYFHIECVDKKMLQ